MLPVQNFEYYNPTKVIFGKDQFNRLPELIRQHHRGIKIMLVYGQGSIKRNGIYSKVIQALRDYEIIEFSGVEPNPDYNTLMKAVNVVQTEKIEFILAVGGGSVIDGTKFICAAAKYDGDPWEVLARKENAIFKDAISFGTVLTLPATGSEMNSGAVISNRELMEKRTMGGPYAFSKFSILDPSVVNSLNNQQLVNGITDTFVHVLEQYLTMPTWNFLQERIAEGILTTLIKISSKIINDPADEVAAGNLMWCSTMALNGTLRSGVCYDWSTHMIAHELTAIYGIDHARTLAIIGPNLYEELIDDKGQKLNQYGQRVWGLEDDCAKEAINTTRAFFQKMGIKTRISDYTLDYDGIQKKIKARFEKREWFSLGERQNISPDVVERIVAASI